MGILMLDRAEEALSITNSFIFWQVDTAFSALNHVLDVFVRALVVDAVSSTGVSDEHNDYPHGETDEQDA